MKHGTSRSLRIERPLLAIIACLALTVAWGCRPSSSDTARQTGEPDWAELRQRMVKDQIEAKGVRDPRVLEAMATVPRHLFGLDEHRSHAYEDAPLPIGDSQSTPQPYVVALMTELLEVGPGDRVLEIGTGSGYQSAVLASMGVEVYSIEIRERLCERASRRLAGLGYSSAHIRCGDGYGGWPEKAPFDGVLVTAAPEEIPEPLLEQLAVGANMVIPIGPFYQDLKVITRTEAGLRERSVIPVRFTGLDRLDGARADGGRSDAVRPERDDPDEAKDDGGARGDAS